MPSPTRLSPLLNPLDFDELAARMRAAPAFPHLAVDDFLEPTFAEEVRLAFPSYRTARAIGRTFDAPNEKGKIQITDATRFPAPIRRLHELLASDAVVTALSRMSGIDGLLADPHLEGGGIHETRGGGRLDVHVDFNVNARTGLHRRLNVLVYFNAGWPACWGGELDLWDADVQRCVGRHAPIFNRMACFATSAVSWHGVTPVRCPAGETRKSFAAYYYTKAAPPGWNGVAHSTLFRPRPDEFWRGEVGTPAESLLRSTRATLASLRRGMKERLAK